MHTLILRKPQVYDYSLGGKDNYAADRVAVEAWLEADPGVAASCRANRAFLGRAVRYLAISHARAQTSWTGRR